MQARPLVATLFMFLAAAGCGPTRTAGTKGTAAKELAVLSITQLPGAAYVKIDAIQFDDGGDLYKIGKGRDFYLRPGDHAASFTLTANVPGIGGRFIPRDALTFSGLKGIPLGTFAAGKTYELAPTVDGFGKLLEGGKLSLVREKAK
jgi:hypothetical protein